MALPGEPPPASVSVTATSGGLAIYRADVVNVGVVAAAGPGYGWQQYRAHVQGISPGGGLKDRAGELAELAAFCAAPGSYWWWQAGAWAGKSALMSSFVLDPPEGVTVVPFFVTARLAAQDDATAFTAGVLAQLDELAGADGPDTAREAGSLPWRLNELAGRLHAEGRMLVLAVDGLDEDRGPEAGQPSIASLLPKHCPAGLKVIVASRPEPRLAADVPADHPLRDPGIVRPLAVSPHAQVIRDSAELELRGLLSGPAEPRELLGLIAAAGGGLTEEDLEELTELAPYELGQILRGVAGRTFITRAASGQSASAYLLAHEELQAEALRSLGRRQVTVLRDRLHRWADSYAAQGWPASTPGYLLSGYAAMLRTAGDTGRIVHCVTDPARHERLLAATGGDYAALAEIAAAQDLLGGQPDPDLTALGRLAYHRATLGLRNREIAPSLPAVWAWLGDAARAVALARSLPDPERQATALTEVAVALTQGAQPRDSWSGSGPGGSGPGGSWQRGSWPRGSWPRGSWQSLAADAARQAAQAARTASDGQDSAQVLREVAVRLAEGGLAGPAIDAAGLARDELNRNVILTKVAVTLARAGRGAEAETAARSIVSVTWQARALIGLVKPLAATGREDRARLVAADVAETIQAVHRPGWRAEQRAGLTPAGHKRPGTGSALSDWQQQALGDLAVALASGGLLAQAQEIVQTVAPGYHQDRALAAVAEGLARAGCPGQAHAVVSAVPPGSQAAREMVTATVALGRAGWLDQAIATASSLGSLPARASALTGLIAALPGPEPPAQLPQLVRAAKAAADAIWPADERAGAWTALAIAVTQAGQPGQARSLADKAVAALARTRPEFTLRLSATEPYYLLPAVRSRGDIAEQLARAGLGELAERVARGRADPDSQGDLDSPEAVLAIVVQTLAEHGHAEQAWKAARRLSADDRLRYDQAIQKLAGALAAAGQIDRAIGLAPGGADTDAAARVPVLAQVAKALTNSGQAERAVDVAESIALGQPRSEALAEIAMAVAERGQPARAADLAARAAIHSGPDTYGWAVAAEELATALVAAGNRELAGALIPTIASPGPRARALGHLAAALARAGQQDQAQRAALAAAAAIQGIASSQWSISLSVVVGALTRAGSCDLAEAVARAASAGDRARTALTTGVHALAHAGHPDRAVALANSISDAEYRAGALADVVGLVSSVHPAEPAVQAAENAARLIAKPALRAELLARLAAARAAASQPGPAGDLAIAAEQAVRAAGDDPQVTRAVVDAMTGATGMLSPRPGAGLCVNGLCDKALARRAEALALSMSPGPGRNAALAAVGTALAQAGWLADARRIARSMSEASPDPVPEADRILTSFAIALIESGRPSKAAGPTRGFASVGPEDLALVAAALARAGRPEQAEALARSRYGPERDVARARVAEALASTGFAERARTLASSIESRGRRAAALAAVARRLAAAGRCEQAEAAARSVDDRDRLSGRLKVPGLVSEHRRDEERDEYPSALLAVARAWANAGKPTRGRRLVALAWVAGPWAGPLSALTVLAPDALVALGQDLLAIADAERGSVRRCRNAAGG